MIKSNYKAAIYTVEIEVSKPPADVFNDLLNLKKWWPENFEGEDIKPECTEFPPNRLNSFVSFCSGKIEKGPSNLRFTSP